jgi:hypothetical protein
MMLNKLIEIILVLILALIYTIGMVDIFICVLSNIEPNMSVLIMTILIGIFLIFYKPDLENI